MIETWKRVLATVIFLPLLYFGLTDNTYHGVYFFCGVVIIGFLAYLELYKIFVKIELMHTFIVPVALVSLYCSLFFRAYTYIGAIFSLTLVLESAYWVKKEQDFKKSLNNILSSLFILFYLGMMWGSTLLLRQFNGLESFFYNENQVFVGSLHFVILLTGTWMCDIGAYFGGRLLGRTKLNLAISPNKTLEGFISGIVVSIISLFAASYFVGVHFTFFMLLLPFGTIVGDLFESLIKRAANVKDSSHLIPGHGGILDVFDALIFTAPLYYFCILPWSAV